MQCKWDIRCGLPHALEATATYTFASPGRVFPDGNLHFVAYGLDVQAVRVNGTVARFHSCDYHADVPSDIPKAVGCTQEHFVRRLAEDGHLCIYARGQSYGSQGTTIEIAYRILAETTDGGLISTAEGPGAVWACAPGLSEGGPLPVPVGVDVIDELYTTFRCVPQGYIACAPGRAQPCTSPADEHAYFAERVARWELGAFVGRASGPFTARPPAGMQLPAHFSVYRVPALPGKLRVFRDVLLLDAALSSESGDALEFYETLGCAAAFVASRICPKQSFASRNTWVFAAICVYSALAADGHRNVRYTHLARLRAAVLRAREKGYASASRALSCPHAPGSTQESAWRAVCAGEGFEWAGAFAARAGWLMHTLEGLGFPVGAFVADFTEAARQRDPKALDTLGLLTALRARASNFVRDEISPGFVRYWLLTEPAPLPHFEGTVEYVPRSTRIHVRLRQVPPEQRPLFEGVVETGVWETSGQWMHEKRADAAAHEWSLLQRTLVKKGKGGRRTRAEEIRAERWRSSKLSNSIEEVLALVTDRRARRFWRTADTVRLAVVDPRCVWLKQSERWAMPLEYYMEVLDCSLLGKEAVPEDDADAFVPRLQASMHVLMQLETLESLATQVNICGSARSYLAGMLHDNTRPLEVREAALFTIVCMTARQIGSGDRSDIVQIANESLLCRVHRETFLAAEKSTLPLLRLGNDVLLAIAQLHFLYDLEPDGTNEPLAHEHVRRSLDTLDPGRTLAGYAAFTRSGGACEETKYFICAKVSEALTALAPHVERALSSGVAEAEGVHALEAVASGLLALTYAHDLTADGDIFEECIMDDEAMNSHRAKALIRNTLDTSEVFRLVREAGPAIARLLLAASRAHVPIDLAFYAAADGTWAQQPLVRTEAHICALLLGCPDDVVSHMHQLASHEHESSVHRAVLRSVVERVQCAGELPGAWRRTEVRVHVVKELRKLQGSRDPVTRSEARRVHEALQVYA